MPELISQSTQKARKAHECGLCCKGIAIGEEYKKQFLKYCGEVYGFKEHLQCNEIANRLWSFIDPDEGMTEEDFQEGCQSYCVQFICPHCEEWDKGIDECKKDESYCLDKIQARLKTHGLRKVKNSFRWAEYELDAKAEGRG
jgi:hypothetical protein